MNNLIPSWSSLQPFSPEIVLAVTACLVLIVAAINRRPNSMTIGAVAALGVGIAIMALFSVESFGAMAINPLAHFAGGGFFNNMLVMDPFAWFFKLSLFIFTLFVVALWVFTTRRQMERGDAPEFFVLLLTATMGMSLMASTSNMLMLFLAIEMASLPSYVLAGFKKTHRPGAEAALKYVLFGAAATAVMLYGMSMLYGLTGSLELSSLAYADVASSEKHFVLALGLMSLLVGIGFKIALVPIHFWAPDVFEGTNFDVAMFLSVASKGAGIALLVRVVAAVTGDSANADHLRWLGVALVTIAALTCFWGNLAAFAQNNIKRLLAYSSIAHAGYMLLAVAVMFSPDTNSGSGSGSSAAGKGAEAFLFYLFMYLFVNAGAFITAAAIEQRIGSEDIRAYAGLGKRLPVLAGCMTVFLFSLVGIPLTCGFGAKLKLFQILYDSHHWIGYTGIVVLALNIVIAAFYYFRIIKQMYLTEGGEGGEEDGIRKTENEGVAFLPVTVLAMLLVVPNVGLFVGYGWVDDEAHTFAHLYRVEGVQSSKVRKGEVQKTEMADLFVVPRS